MVLPLVLFSDVWRKQSKAKPFSKTCQKPIRNHTPKAQNPCRSFCSHRCLPGNQIDQQQKGHRGTAEIHRMAAIGSENTFRLLIYFWSQIIITIYIYIYIYLCIYLLANYVLSQIQWHPPYGSISFQNHPSRSKTDDQINTDMISLLISRCHGHYLVM